MELQDFTFKDCGNYCVLKRNGKVVVSIDSDVLDLIAQDLHFMDCLLKIYYKKGNCRTLI